MIASECDLSLVICTRNRADQLVQTLNRVLALPSRLTWELIVVDNASTDRTSAVMKEYAVACDRPIRLAYQAGRGVSYARNAGWRLAKADIVAYTDDDCYPAEGYLDAVFDCLSEGPRLGYVGGRVLSYGPGDYNLTRQDSLERLSFPPGSFIRPGVLQGASLAFRRAALAQVGGFDPWFGAGALFTAEEPELLARISAAGWTGAYDPRLLVYHDHGRQTARTQWLKARSYDRGRGAYYAKCILNKGMREVYIRNWVRTRRHHSWRVSTLEIAAGLEYVARSVVAGRLPDRENGRGFDFSR
jgi:glycosyltransferase involved in cell wall biosynthesis